MLLVEDDPLMSRVVMRGLRDQEWVVDHAPNGCSALASAVANPYDVIVLDVMIPAPDGFEVCRRIREQGIATPILMLTARNAVEDRIEGLDVGADDYLVKPFSFEELFARLRALVRRCPNALSGRIVIGGLELDTRNQRAMLKGKLLSLNAKEYSLLELLARNVGRPLCRGEISRHVWDDSFDPASNALEVTIARLRRKLETRGAGPVIHTQRGAGYMMVAPAASG
jgi:DNA-binding response OmpR family regulator